MTIEDIYLFPLVPELIINAECESNDEEHLNDFYLVVCFVLKVPGILYANI